MKPVTFAFTLAAFFMILLCAAAQDSGGEGGKYEDSPFGFHPATAPGEDPYRYAKDIGVRWDRSGLYFMWVLVQKDLTKKKYDWSRYDKLMKDLPEGMWLMRNITTAHANMISGRVQPPGRRNRERININQYLKQGSYLPKDENAYMNFVSACVERYDGDGIDDMPQLKTPIKYWQVANEPPRGLTDYPRLVEITCSAIKKADKDAKVIIGGATGFPDRYNEIFKKEYLPILKELNGRHVDIFDFHWYGNATGDYKFDKVFECISKELKECGFKDIPVWVTEMGSYSGEPRGCFGEKTAYQSEKQQAADLLRRYVYPLSRGVRKIFWAWGMVEGFKHDDGYFDHTGLIYDGRFRNDEGKGVKKQAYYTYRLMTQKLEGSDWSRIETLQKGEDNVFIFKFPRKNSTTEVYVAWWDYFQEKGYKEGDKKEISLKLPDGEYKVTSAITTDEGEERSVSKKTENGKLTGKLGEDPIFIKLKE